MSTTAKLSSRNPTIKRIMKEASELATQPSPDYHAAPLETDLFEWHFTLRGPPAPSPFEGGVYHGRIILPPAYPLKPPSFRFLTPSGRFEANREICLSISGHHEETWQPAWGIRTALVALRSFMDTDANGQIGGMVTGDETRRRLATQSSSWKCPGCTRSNAEIIAEQEKLVREAGEDAATRRDEQVPEELRLAYREDINKKDQDKKAEGTATVNENTVKSPPTSTTTTLASTSPSQTASTVHSAASSSVIGHSAPAATIATPVVPPQTTRQPPRPLRQPDGIPSWIDKAIGGVILVILFRVWLRYWS